MEGVGMERLSWKLGRQLDRGVMKRLGWSVGGRDVVRTGVKE